VSLQAEKQQELALFRLFHNERELEEVGKELEKQQNSVAKIERSKEAKEEELRERKRDGTKVTKELAKLDQDIREIVSSISVFVT
jgi:structural maintenance of chromosome 1